MFEAQIPVDTVSTVAILIPVFNDWECARLLAERLSAALQGRAAHLLLVDDGSTDPVPHDFGYAVRGFATADIIHLQSNVGHQRAIAVGLYCIHRQFPCRAVVVMDGDGEDRAEDVPKLLNEFERQGAPRVVFAARTKRLEGAVFQGFYQLYRAAHWLLTGIAVRVGNFSVLPGSFVGRLMVVPDLWNHYAASIFRSRIPFVTVATERGKRLHGRSRMNFVGLAVHGLSAISVFSDIVAARLLLAVVASALVVAAVSISSLTALSAALIAETLVLAALIVFLMIGLRSHMTFLPARDAGYFVASVRRIHTSEMGEPGTRALESLEQWLNSHTPVTS